MSLSVSPWDLALLAVVTLMGTLIAFIDDPRWKAFLLALPFPFTLANLSLAEQIGPSHVMGMATLLLFTNLVRWLHTGMKVPIIPAIAISAAVNLGLGAVLNRLVPRDAVVFWIILGCVMALGVLLVLLLPHRQEQAHRSSMAVLPKIAAIAGVIAVIVILKKTLGGFMTVFPMVGTIAAYEARHSLWTISRQIPILFVTMGPMMAVIWVAQHSLHASIPLSLAAGWATLAVTLTPVTIVQMANARRAVASTGIST